MNLSRFPLTFPFAFNDFVGFPSSGPDRAATGVIDQEQIVSVHTYSGVQLYQFLGSELMDLSWSRESRQVSRCEVTVPSTLNYDSLPDIIPWLHWISVWDSSGQELYWTGPIQKASVDRESMVLMACDMASLFTRTRCPVTKRWDVTDPADIAGELVAAMVEHHGLYSKAIVRHDPLGDKFDFATRADATMLDSVVDELVNLGLFWTVVGGVPILGPWQRQIVAALSENDFVDGGMTVIRDGSATFNDVLLRGADNLARAIVPMGGLSLQTTYDIDSMFGVSNTDRAVKQYARYVSVIHDTIALPDNAVLHPNAPVTISELIPSSRFSVDAYGLLVQMELTGIEVSCTSDATTVGVRMTGVNDELPELVEIQAQASISGVGR